MFSPKVTHTATATQIAVRSHTQNPRGHTLSAPQVTGSQPPRSHASPKVARSAPEVMMQFIPLFQHTPQSHTAPQEPEEAVLP